MWFASLFLRFLYHLTQHLPWLPFPSPCIILSFHFYFVDILHFTITHFHLQIISSTLFLILWSFLFSIIISLFSYQELNNLFIPCLFFLIYCSCLLIPYVILLNSTMLFAHKILIFIILITLLLPCYLPLHFASTPSSSTSILSSLLFSSLIQKFPDFWFHIFSPKFMHFSLLLAHFWSVLPKFMHFSEFSEFLSGIQFHLCSYLFLFLSSAIFTLLFALLNHILFLNLFSYLSFKKSFYSISSLSYRYF